MSEELPAQEIKQYYTTMKTVLMNMNEGDELTLHELNTVVHCPRIYPLYELVQMFLKRSPGFFIYSSYNTLEASRVIRSTPKNSL